MARSWALTVAVLVCAACDAAPAASPRIDLVVQPDGVGFHINVNDGFWLSSEPVFIQAGGQLLKAGNGLTLLNHSGPTPGTDRVLGGFVEHTWVWAASGAVKLHMVTSARVFTNHPTINFTSSFRDGVDDFGFGKLGPDVWGRPATGWPSLRASPSLAKTLEHVTFVGDGDVSFGAGLGAAPGFNAGAAVGHFNASGDTLIMSSAASFLSSVMGCSDGVLSGGVQGTALALPAGYSTSFVLHAGSGITEAFLRWGDVLLAAYGKPRAAPNSSVSLEYLGYSTTGPVGTHP